MSPLGHVQIITSIIREEKSHAIELKQWGEIAPGQRDQSNMLIQQFIFNKAYGLTDKTDVVWYKMYYE